MHSLISTNQPSMEEQLVQSTVAGLRELEKLYVWDFSKAIDDIEWLFDAHHEPVKPFDKPLTAQQLRQADGVCPRHHEALELSEYGNPDADKVCPKCEAELQEVA